jgi:hypothetical protein
LVSLVHQKPVGYNLKKLTFDFFGKKQKPENSSDIPEKPNDKPVGLPLFIHRLNFK